MPTTSPIAISADVDDDLVYGTGAVYASATFVGNNPTQTSLFAPYKAFDGANYDIRNLLLRFDTGSVLPDTAIVTGATLRLRIESHSDVDTRSITADWNGAWTGVAADWSIAALTTAHAGTALSTFTTDNFDYDFTLTGYGGGNVSTTGYTNLRVHISGGAPTGYNYVAVSAFGHATNPAPRIIVDYVVGTPTRIAPDAILSQTNLTGTVSAIQDDPDAETGTWLTAP